MPDWRRLVNRRLRRLNVPTERRDEIAREMAGFLEDHYAERLRLGDSPRNARRAAIAGAGRWPDVVRALEREEDAVSHRLKALWLPSLGMSLAAMGLLLAVARFGAGVQIVWHPPQPPVILYWPWLMALPLLGAAGTGWSRRMGGGRLERTLVTLFPALVFLALLLVGLAALLRQELSAGEKLVVLSIGVLNWAVLPAAALLLGTLASPSTRSATLPPD